MKCRDFATKLKHLIKMLAQFEARVWVKPSSREIEPLAFRDAVSLSAFNYLAFPKPKPEAERVVGNPAGA